MSFVHSSKALGPIVVKVSGKDMEVTSSHAMNAPTISVTVYSFSLYIAFSGTMMSPVYFVVVRVDVSLHVSSDVISNRSPL